MHFNNILKQFSQHEALRATVIAKPILVSIKCHANSNEREYKRSAFVI